MGNWTSDARLRVFARPSSWIEGAAIRQLESLTTLRGFEAAAGMPDLHPGHKGPVGCAVSTRGVVHPFLVGTDIGCGMTAWRIARGTRLSVDKAERRLARLGAEAGADPAEAVAVGLSAADAERFAPGLGTVGGGNHFVELQRVDAADEASGLAPDDILILVHSGSRAFGAEVFARHGGGTDGLELEGAGTAYLRDHAAAVAFASLNRACLATRAADLLGVDAARWLDVPHNLVETEGDVVLHRKGAAPADRGPVPVPGSRGSATHYVLPDPAAAGALRSICHGAGRKRNRGDADRARRPERSRLICTDRRLEAEEAPSMYKDIRLVIGDLEHFGLARSFASATPLVTFKSGGDAHGR